MFMWMISFSLKDDLTEMDRLKRNFATKFEIKDLGSLKYFLYIEIARSKKGIMVSQRKYILDLLKEIGMSDSKPSKTPMEANLRLGDSDKNVPVDTARYQRLVGKLIYLSHTLLDIAFVVSVVSVVSQFMHSPYEQNLEVVY